MEFNLQPGMIAEKKELVTEEKLAISYGSGEVAVYATPAMIGLMENAALSCVDKNLPEGWSTVGSYLDVKHIAATPPGLTVTAKAEVVKVDGRRVVFKVEAFDDKDKIGEGTHERFIINLEKFMKKCDEKRE